MYDYKDYTNTVRWLRLRYQSSHSLEALSIRSWVRYECDWLLSPIYYQFCHHFKIDEDPILRYSARIPIDDSKANLLRDNRLPIAPETCRVYHRNCPYAKLWHKNNARMSSRHFKLVDLEHFLKLAMRHRHCFNIAPAELGRAIAHYLIRLRRLVPDTEQGFSQLPWENAPQPHAVRAMTWKEWHDFGFE